MITVTGATGALGRLVIDQLIDRGVGPADIVAAVRNPGSADDIAARGVNVREADYDRPETLAIALKDASRLLLISSNQVGQRVPQHRNVIDAAIAADVDLIAYTSVLRADTSALGLAAEHKATEELLAGSRLPVTVLRNDWYIENYTRSLPTVLEQGAILGAARDGRISAATRADFAAAAAAVLTSAGHAGRTYELGGEPAFTLGELAETITRVSGTQVVYRDLPPAELVAALLATGVPEPVAEFLADTDRGIASGDLYTASHELRDLIGRPTTSLADAVAAAVG